MSKKLAPKKPVADKPEKKASGRPPKYNDPKFIEPLCEVLAGGATLAAACRRAQVKYRSVRTWIVAGESGDERYSYFMHAIKKAEADNEISLVAEIRLAAKTQWQAAAWLLERRYPKRYGRRNNVSFNGDAVVKNGNISPEQFVKMLSADQLAQLISAVEAKTAELETAKDNNHISALTTGE